MKHDAIRFKTRISNQSRIPILLFSVACIGFHACFWGPKTLEEEVIPYSGFGLNIFDGSIAMVYQNDVFVLDPNGRPPKQLTDSPGESKTRIALSHAKDKIAYLDADAYPVIIDSSGQELAHLTDRGPIRFLGWSGDDETLWMMGNGGLAFQYYGPDMELPNNPISPASYLDAVDVSSSGVVIFVSAPFMSVHTPDPSDGFTATIGSGNDYLNISPDGTKAILTKSNQQNGMGYYSLKVLDIKEKQFRTKQLTPTDLMCPILDESGARIMYATNERGYEIPYQFTNIRQAPLSFFNSDVPYGSFLSLIEAQSEAVYLDWKP